MVVIRTSCPKRLVDADTLAQTDIWPIYEQVLAGDDPDQIDINVARERQREFVAQVQQAGLGVIGPHVKAIWTGEQARFAAEATLIFQNTLHQGSLEFQIPDGDRIKVEAELAFVARDTYSVIDLLQLDDEQLLSHFTPHTGLDVIDIGAGRDRAQSSIILRNSDNCFATVGESFEITGVAQLADAAATLRFQLDGEQIAVRPLAQTHSDILRKLIQHSSLQNSQGELSAGATFFTGAHAHVTLSQENAGQTVTLQLPFAREALALTVVPDLAGNDSVGWNVATYSRVAGPQFQKAVYLSRQHDFTGDEVVWDLGCGDGNVALNLLKPLVPDGMVIGIDKDSNMVEAAQQKISSESQEGVSVLPGDIRELENHIGEMLQVSAGRSPAVVYSNSVLNYCIRNLDEHRTFLSTLAGVMESESVLLLSFTGQGNFTDLEDGRRVAREASDFERYFTGYTDPGRYDPSPEDYVTLLEECGFQASGVFLCDQARKALDPDVPRQIFESREAAALWVSTSIKSHMKFLEAGGADQEEQIAFGLAVIDAYLEQHPEHESDEGVVELDNVSLIVRAVKR